MCCLCSYFSFVLFYFSVHLFCTRRTTWNNINFHYALLTSNETSTSQTKNSYILHKYKKYSQHRTTALSITSQLLSDFIPMDLYKSYISNWDTLVIEEKTISHCIGSVASEANFTWSCHIKHFCQVFYFNLCCMREQWKNNFCQLSEAIFNLANESWTPFPLPLIVKYSAKIARI